MRNKIVFLLICTAFVACSEPEPREPVKATSGTFFRESIKRNKILLAQEESAIKERIEADSANTYLPSEEGFWFKYITKDSTESYTPHENDLVKLTYNVQTINGQVIYSKTSIDTIIYKVDKQQNLFMGLRKAIKLLKKGEEATFYFPSTLAYGYVGDHKKIGVNMPLKSDLKIIDIKKVQDSIPH